MSDSSGMPPSGNEWGGSTPPPLPEQGMPPRKPSALESIDAQLAEPRFQETNRNFLPIVIGGAVLIVVAVIFALVVANRSSDKGSTLTPPVATGEPAATPTDLELTSGSSAVTGADGATGAAYAVVVHNPNAIGWTAYDVQITGAFVAADGSTVASVNQTVPAIAPGQTVAVADLAAGATPDAVFTPAAVVGRWDAAGSPPGQITAGSIKTATASGVTRTTVTLTSPLDFDSTATAVAVYYAEDGAILGGATLAGTSVPARGSVTVDIDGPFEIAGVKRTEVYVAAAAV